MPEIFGIFKSSGLEPVHRQGYSGMHAAFSVYDHINTYKEETPCLLLSLLISNKHDNKHYNIEKNEKFVSGWIGQNINSDTNFNQDEVFKKYLSKDLSIFDTLNPPFCSAISSPDNCQLWLTSDHFGHYPIYYINFNDTIIFSTKLAPILHTALFSWELDLSAIYEFFTFEHVLENKTFIKNVSLIPAGTVINFKDGKSYKYSYIEHLKQATYVPKTTAEVASTLLNSLQNSISQACKYSKKTAITLSGGLDSRAILGSALDNTSSLSAFTFGPESSADVQCARKLALQAGISHDVIPISGTYLLEWLKHGLFTTGGMVSCIHYQILSLASALAQNSDLVLDGLGGDMFTGAHIEWPMVFARTKKRSIDVLHSQRARTWANEADQKKIFTADFLNELDSKNNILKKYYENLKPADLWKGSHNFDYQERQRRFIQYGPHQIRPFVPVHTPFYEPKFSFNMREVNIKYLIGQRAYRYMHKHYLKDLAGVPEATGGVPVSYPACIHFAKRVLDFGRRRLPTQLNKSFGLKNTSATNYPEWFRNELHELVHDHILSNEALRSYVDTQFAETLLKQHMSHEANHTTKIGVLLTFSAWIESIKSL